MDYEVLHKVVYQYNNGITTDVIEIKTLSKNLDDENPSFTFRIDHPLKSVEWDTCEENCGGFEYVSEEDAFDGAVDYFINHFVPFLYIEEDPEQIRQSLYNDFDIRYYYDENPENNIEEEPEDFIFNK